MIPEMLKIDGLEGKWKRRIKSKDKLKRRPTSKLLKI